jgi:AraC family transcriptional regulator
MSRKHPPSINHVEWSRLTPKPPLLTSFQSNWKNIHLAYSCQPATTLPKVVSSQHIISVPLSHETYNDQMGDMELSTEGKSLQLSYHRKDYASGPFTIIPANLEHGVSIDKKVQIIEFIHCYLEPSFLAQVSHESVNTEYVELILIPKEADLLIKQIGIALKSSLEVDGAGSCFYADSMATALSAHLLRHYSTRKYHLREYEDGLSKQKLKQATEYIQAHLGENLSLNEVANELGMSQYYFCRLFKQSTGVSPHQYLIRQRVEQAKRLLKNPEHNITWIALECGFANQSHFAKCFRQHTGMNPNQFRKL